VKCNDHNSKHYKVRLLKNNDKKTLALSHALDIRKFEIELYWKRATYFWTFIGASFAGYITLKSSEAKTDDNLSLLISCLGMLFSLGWLCVNKGSKFWQENWENHVDFLEDSNTGPLYKTVTSSISESNKREKIKDFFTGSLPYSVSKVNQIISLYIFIIWLSIFINDLFKTYYAGGFSLLSIALLFMTINFCFIILLLGKTSFKDKKIKVRTRKTEIE